MTISTFSTVSRNTRWTTLALLALTVGSGPLRSQLRVAPPPSPRGELRIENVSAFGAYYSTGLPNRIGQGSADLPADVGYGGGAQFSWLKLTEKSQFSVTYAPVYSGRIRYTEFNALNHMFSFSAGGRFPANGGRAYLEVPASRIRTSFYFLRLFSVLYLPPPQVLMNSPEP